MVLEAVAVRCAGSSPVPGTNKDLRCCNLSGLDRSYTAPLSCLHKSGCDERYQFGPSGGQPDLLRASGRSSETCMAVIGHHHVFRGEASPCSVRQSNPCCRMARMRARSHSGPPRSAAAKLGRSCSAGTRRCAGGSEGLNSCSYRVRNACR